MRRIKRAKKVKDDAQDGRREVVEVEAIVQVPVKVKLTLAVDFKQANRGSVKQAVEFSLAGQTAPGVVNVYEMNRIILAIGDESVDEEAAIASTDNALEMALDNAIEAGEGVKYVKHKVVE